MQDQKKINIYQLYSLLFIAMCAVVFVQFALYGRTFVWKEDGRTQHLQAYIYYGRYLRTVLYTIFVEHSLNIPQWDFSIGEGSDIFSTFNYYVIGDPFAFLSVLFPSRLMYVYYCGMCIVRIYCAGIAFIYLCRVLGHYEKTPVLAGALMYIFCYWAICYCTRHPYFLNPLVLFPLIIAGIERIIQGKHPFLYIFFVMVAAVSNFYFFYMIVIFVVLYIVLRLSYLYRRDIHKIIRTILSFFLYSCLSLGLAAFLFLPICYIFLHDARMGQHSLVYCFYPLSYYLELPLHFVFPKSIFAGRMGGYPVLSIVSIMMLFKNPKKNCFLIILYAVCSIIILLPICGFVLNGFSYVINRWSWAFSLLCSYTVVATWEQLLKAYKIVFPLSFSLVLYSMMVSVGQRLAIICYVLFLLAFAFSARKSDLFRAIVALIIICLNIMLNANIHYHTYYKQCLTLQEASEVLKTEASLIKKAAAGDKDFFRYSGSELTRNTSINQGLSSPIHYWTLTNPNIVEFREKMEFPFPSMIHRHKDYNSSAIVESLSCVRYFYYKRTKTSSVPIPYMFYPTKQKNVYKSDYSLPIAYTYDSFMLQSDWNELNSVQKQESLLQLAVLEEPCDVVPSGVPLFLSRPVPFAVGWDGNSQEGGNLFEISGARSPIPLFLAPQEPGELYVCLKNFRYVGSEEERIKVYISASNGKKVPFDLTTPRWKWYTGLHDVSANVGYSEKNIDSVSIHLDKPGTYSIDDIQVISLPMTRFASLIDERRKDVFCNVKFGTNTVEGDISLAGPKLLCFAIPFAEGWRATVDGKSASLFRTNVMHMSVPLEAGEHKVVLRYHTPFLKLGVLVSLFSLVIFLLWIYKTRRG